MCPLNRKLQNQQINTSYLCPLQVFLCVWKFWYKLNIYESFIYLMCTYFTWPTKFVMINVISSCCSALTCCIDVFSLSIRCMFCLRSLLFVFSQQPQQEIFYLKLYNSKSCHISDLCRVCIIIFGLVKLIALTRLFDLK